MDILVSFYSRTGNTRTIGEEISGYLDADTDEIIEKKDRSGILGWLSAAKDARFKKSTEITLSEHPEQYDLVIVGSPVWAGRVTPAVRTYLKENSFKEIAFFCSYGALGVGKTFEMMRELSKEPIATLVVKEEGTEKEEKEKIKQFCEEVAVLIS